MRHTPILLLALLSLITVDAMAQDASWEWGYRFRAGDTYRYRRTSDHHDTAWKEQGVTISEVDAAVESVDSAGNATILLTLVEHRDSAEDEAAAGEGVSTTTASGMTITTIRASGEIPQCRIVVSPLGAYISGTITIDDPDRIAFRERMKEPGFRGNQAPDSSMMKRLTRNWFAQLPKRRALSAGDRWSDTLVESRVLQSIQLGNSGEGAGTSATPTPPPRSHRQISETIKDYEVQGTIIRDGEECVRVLTKKRVVSGIEGAAVSTFTTTGEMVLRKRDGQLVYAREITDGDMGGRQKGTHWDVVNELVR